MNVLNTSNRTKTCYMHNISPDSKVKTCNLQTVSSRHRRRQQRSGRCTINLIDAVIKKIDLVDCAKAITFAQKLVIMFK
jgi:hypothetical protein